MRKEQDYSKDIAEIRSMMERSSKFLSLSGWAGIMAGVYALFGAYIAYSVYGFNPQSIYHSTQQTGSLFESMPEVFLLAIIVLFLALITAIYFSHRNAKKRGEAIWNPTSRRLLGSMAVPLTAGGILIPILIGKGLIGLIAPASLVFYGIALYNASKFSIAEVKYLGVIQIGLGLLGFYFIEYGLILWAIGFGIVHIIYGILIHVRHER